MKKAYVYTGRAIYVNSQLDHQVRNDLSVWKKSMRLFGLK